MATTSASDTFTVFKFKETGIVALCAEIVAYAQDGTFDRCNVDLNNVRFEAKHDEIRFVFGYKAKDEVEENLYGAWSVLSTELLLYLKTETVERQRAIPAHFTAKSLRVLDRILDERGVE